MNKTGLVLLVLFFTGCSKNSTNDNELPVITISTPANNQEYTAGEMIVITGTVTDNNSIEEIHIHVNNLDTGAEIVDEHIDPAGNSATFNRTLAAVAATNYKIEILATDGSANEARQTITVKCN